MDEYKIARKVRALLRVSNLGHLMINLAIVDSQGHEAFKGLMNAMITTLIAKHDLKRNSGNSERSPTISTTLSANSGSSLIVNVLFRCGLI